MVRLSVNINKIALIRNSRGADYPNLLQVAKDCESFGAQGITVHPRPDQRHIRYSDLSPLKEQVKTEFNIEGFPSEHFLEEVCRVKPHQCTLVPDPPDALTSDTGWDTIAHKDFLTKVISRLHQHQIRVSLFLNPLPHLVEGAKDVGSDRIELYTGQYAHQFSTDPEKAIAPHVATGLKAEELGLEVNAGHDLNLENLSYYKRHLPNLLEVSIGHALVCDSIYYGLEATIKMYLDELTAAN